MCVNFFLPSLSVSPYNSFTSSFLLYLKRRGKRFFKCRKEIVGFARTSSFSCRCRQVRYLVSYPFSWAFPFLSLELSGQITPDWPRPPTSTSTARVPFASYLKAVQTLKRCLVNKTSDRRMVPNALRLVLFVLFMTCTRSSYTSFLFQRH